MQCLRASKLPSEREHISPWLVSATTPSWLSSLARNYLNPDWKMIDLAKYLKGKTQKSINHISVSCPYHNRMQTLADMLIIYGGLGQSIVLCSTEVETSSLLLPEKIASKIEVMHGDIAQNQREVTLQRFREDKFQILASKDVAGEIDQFIRSSWELLRVAISDSERITNEESLADYKPI